MYGLLYYIGGERNTIAAAELRAIGLDYAFDQGENVQARGVQHGPDGGRGLIVARTDQEDVGYYPARQRWVRLLAAASGDAQPVCGQPCQADGEARRIPVWVGMVTDRAAPGPEELARQELLDGHMIELLDGRRWLVPIARATVQSDGMLVARMNLPAPCVPDEQGRWRIGPVLPCWESLWRRAERVWDGLEAEIEDEAEGGRQLTASEALDIAVAALRANYRIERGEAGLLGLLDQQRAMKICGALVDLPTIRDWLKKKAAAAGSGCAAGPAD
jgi:hypothetical protein